MESTSRRCDANGLLGSAAQLEGDPIVCIPGVVLPALNGGEVGPSVAIKVCYRELRGDLQGGSRPTLRHAGPCAYARCEAQGQAQKCKCRSDGFRPRETHLTQRFHEPDSQIKTISQPSNPRGS